MIWDEYTVIDIGSSRRYMDASTIPKDNQIFPFSNIYLMNWIWFFFSPSYCAYFIQVKYLWLLFDLAAGPDNLVENGPYKWVTGSSAFLFFISSSWY